MSAYANPILLDKNLIGTSISRVSFSGSVSEEGFDERWLQDALFCNPSSLPIQEISSHVGDLIPICTELETGSGPADILFVTPTGQIVLVETKLFRNPEARRTVVVQLLDYAHQLVSWDYAKLEFATAQRAKADPKNFLLNRLHATCAAADEKVFYEGIERCLREGDFLLLIVGDGIRSNASSLVGFLERFGQFKFKLALVEVAVFQLPDGHRLLQPRILARTEILERTVLVGPNGPLTFEQAAQTEDAVDSPNFAVQQSFQRFWGEFLKRLGQLDPSLATGAPAKATNQFFPMPPSGADAWVSAYVSRSSGKCGVYLTFGKNFVIGPKIFELLKSDSDAIEKSIGATLEWEKNGSKVFVSAPNISFTSLDAEQDRDRVIEYLARTTTLMVSVLTPRVKDALAQIGE